MQDFLTFRKYITPYMIQALFWLGVVASLTTGIILIVQGVADTYRGGGLTVLSGVLVLLLGPLFSRIWCEKTKVLFHLYEKSCDETQKPS